MRYLVAVLLIEGFALGQEIMTPEGMEQKPTVHEITMQDRRDAAHRCLTERTRLDSVVRNASTPFGQKNAQLQKALTDAKRDLQECERRAAEWLEDLRVNGTFAEREQKRQAAEFAARQAAEAKEANDQEAEAEATRRDPKAMSVVFGAIFCYTKNLRNVALAEIAKEKKYARIGGMVNKVKLYNLQQAIRWADETEAEERKNLKGYRRVVPLGCNNASVAAVTQCLGEAENCSGDVPRHLATFVPEYSPGSDDE